MEQTSPKVGTLETDKFPAIKSIHNQFKLVNKGPLRTIVSITTTSTSKGATHPQDSSQLLHNLPNSFRQKTNIEIDKYWSM